MIARIWSGESRYGGYCCRSRLYGTVSGAIRLSYKLGFKRAASAGTGGCGRESYGWR